MPEPGVWGPLNCIFDLIRAQALRIGGQVPTSEVLQVGES
jgi:hypothetical protein